MFAIRLDVFRQKSGIFNLTTFYKFTYSQLLSPRIRLTARQRHVLVSPSTKVTEMLRLQSDLFLVNPLTIYLVNAFQFFFLLQIAVVAANLTKLWNCSKINANT